MKEKQERLLAVTNQKFVDFLNRLGLLEDYVDNVENSRESMDFMKQVPEGGYIDATFVWEYALFPESIPGGRGGLGLREVLWTGINTKWKANL